MILAHPELEKLVLRTCQLIDQINQQQTSDFVANFFKPIKIVEKSTDSFVTLFNTQMLNVHVQAKQVGIFTPLSPLSYTKVQTCTCGSVDFVECDGSSQCDRCGALLRNQLAVAWSDVSRVHAAPIYMYDRKLQWQAKFKEWILQYQGIGTYSWPDTLLKKLAVQCKTHQPTKPEFANMVRIISQHRINTDHVHALYYQVTGVAPPNLARFENVLLTDFDTFIDMYCKTGLVTHKVKITGPFNQFLLYQFLNRYGVQTSKEDVLLKEWVTDNISCTVFNLLQWTMY